MSPPGRRAGTRRAGTRRARGTALLVRTPGPWVRLGLAAVQRRVPHAAVVAVHVDFGSQTTGLTGRAPSFHFLPHLQVLLDSCKTMAV